MFSDGMENDLLKQAKELSKRFLSKKAIGSIASPCYGKKYLFIWLVGQDTFPHLATSKMPTWVRPWM